jgi:hypothetical protein
MCTVAFAPAASGGYVLGHNRDERLSRARGIAPALIAAEPLHFLAPRDPEAGGTWIGVNAAGMTVCMLNAAEPPERELPAPPRSRGLVAWEALRQPSAVAILDMLSADDLSDVRSFQLAVASPGSPWSRPSLLHVRWNGFGLSWDVLSGAQVLVSSTKDQARAELERRASWARLLDGAGSVERERIAAWLAGHEPEPGAWSACMHREDARTMSRTVVDVGPEGIRLEYLDGQPCDPAAGVTLLTLA